MNLIGQQLLHYHILEKLGEGGMGVVYKAEDTKLKRDVAIKFLPRQIVSSDEERERFNIEAQAAAALNHPNIATIHAIEEHDDEMFIVMEYIEGKELKDIVGAEDLQPLPVDDVLDYATQIASGLQAAHKKGVTHRDIKSSNIMITEGQVKIMDFGLAKVRGGPQLTKDQSTLGTAAYMSPEQAQGEAADHRSDIWSFGVVLYEMFTGQLPYKGDYEQSVIYAILNEEPDFTDIADEAATVVRKALAKQVQDRYQNAQDLLADLKKLRTGRNTSSGLTAKATSKRWAFMVVGLAVMALVAFLATFLFNSSGVDSVASAKSIAVLPFTDRSPTKDQEYFGDGMAEAVINALGQIPGLKVSARTSAFQFKGGESDIQTIGEKLRVATVLEGSVAKSGNKLRVTAQLVNAADGFHLWSDTYDRELTDIFAIQDDLSRSIVEALRVELAGDEPQISSKGHTTNIEARGGDKFHPPDILLKKSLKIDSVCFSGGSMFSFLTFICRLIFNLGISKKDLLLQVSLQQKEIEILKRKHRARRVRFRFSDRLVFAILNKAGHLKERFSVVKPETVLGWQRQLIKHFWTFKNTKRVGRPPVSNDIKQLILAMKNDNLYWGYKKIQGELQKLDINLDKKTIRNILGDFRRRGKIRQSLTWKKFLSLQIQSIYAMDFLTIDTLLNQRLYVFFIIYHQTREIAHVAITRNPCREFVRQQLIEFGDK
jgi:serine/threonine protein kinase